ncbi:MAG: CocE/NonD family hydrolase [Microthrixaceae bacterium]
MALPRHRLAREFLACVVAGVLIASCSSSGSKEAAAEKVEPAVCVPPKDTTTVDVTSVGESTTDFDVISFDGTRIRAHWFPHPDASKESPHPTVLMGPGWSLAGDTDIDGPSLLGSIDIRSMREAGYNVLTWDPRGFGESDGTATVDSADFEGRDVQQLIDWVATLPTVQLDGPHDPRMGMVGGSYGGGIQLVTAPNDCRIDALVPIIAWHSLRSSLFKSDTIKLGWASVLADAAANNSIDKHVESAISSAAETGRISDTDRKWFISRGPGDLVKKIKVPTLFIQGTVDTLFTLDEAVTNYEILKANGVATKMLWNCDGHGLCLVFEGDRTRASRAAIDWLNRYVRQDKSVDTGPEFDVIDQNGVRYTADEYKPADGKPVSGSGSGTLFLTSDGGAGPVVLPEGYESILSGLAQKITPGRADNAVNVELNAGETESLLVGAPRLSLTYSGLAADGNRPERVFAQLIDETTGLVIGNQITPVKVTLDGADHTANLDMEMIAFAMKPGAKVTLQIVATTVAYADPQLGGSIQFSKIALDLPVATYLKRVD